LSICREITWSPLTRDHAEGTIVDVSVWTVELGSVEGVEVIHRQNALKPLAHVEVLSGVEVFKKERGVSEP
jgi:hypothetical protein